MFLICINDIIEGISSNIKLFADDTSLFIEVEDPSIAAEVLNSDLDKIKVWTDQWVVKFSLEKNMLMTCSERSVNHPDIVFDGAVLPESDTHTLLGITWSFNMSWSSHMDNIIGSVSPMADVLRKLKNIERIYFSFFRPNLEYGCPIWDSFGKGD